MSTRYVALLRGINVGGKNVLPMGALTDMFVRAGCRSVQTYLQSGNVIFSATPNVVEDLPEKISTQIADNFGFRVPVILRSADQLRAILGDNPYGDSPLQGWRQVRPPSASFGDGCPADDCLHVLFLANRPLRAYLETLDPYRSLPDTFALHDQEIYLRLADGVAGTTFTSAYFDNRLKTVCTGRDWQTVSRLTQLAMD